MGEIEKLENRIEELKDRIAEIGRMLDDDSISDEKFVELGHAAADLQQQIGVAERRLELISAKRINANEWLADFLASLGECSRKITNRQVDVFRRTNYGRPFIYNGFRYDCNGPDYRAGFAYVVISQI